MAPTHRVRAAVLAALAIALYANTLGHGYALDDRLVITHNEIVQAGWAGLPRLLEGDYLRGYLGDVAMPSRLEGNPLVGAKTRAQLDDNLGCLEFELSAEDVARLDAVSKIDLGFPHDFLQQFSSSSIVNHRA